MKKNILILLFLTLIINGLYFNYRNDKTIRYIYDYRYNSIYDDVSYFNQVYKLLKEKNIILYRKRNNKLIEVKNEIEIIDTLLRILSITHKDGNQIILNKKKLLSKGLGLEGNPKNPLISIPKEIEDDILKNANKYKIMNVYSLIEVLLGMKL